MNYIAIKDGFLKEYPDYKHDIDNFNEYFEKQWNNSLTDDTTRFFLQGLDVEFILKSLIYNVEEVNRYRSKATAKRYATVIGQFFNYIRRNTDIENPKLYDAISYNRLRENTYMKRMMAYIDASEDLAGVVHLEALSRGEVVKIIKWTEAQFEESEWGDATKFRKAIAAIAIKLMLLYGVTYRELRKIKIKDIDIVYGYISINGFVLRLPVKLLVQIKQMKRFMEENELNNEDGLLFVDSTGKRWAEITSYSGIPDYLGALIGTTSLTSVIKYGISQLLKAGLSDSIIKKLTGASEKMIQGCLQHEDEELNRIVNNKLVTVELYYEF